MTRRETLRLIRDALIPMYGEREAESIALLAASELSGVARSGFMIDPSAELEIRDLDAVIELLKRGCPVQYVTGEAEFWGHAFTVREGVLIPRPETEELVDWIIREEGAAQRILDVGTGSGCIAASLKLDLPHAAVFATDLSDAALKITQENFAKLGAEVTLRKGDALSNLREVFPETFDVIVSNPPYVPQSDLSTMDINVKDYEPHIALFVPDDDALKFYRAIARQGQSMLREGGHLYFEIYHLYAQEMCEMLAKEGYHAIELREDLFGKPRMIRCQK